MKDNPKSIGLGPKIGVAAVVVAAVCCAGPVLIAAGALSVLGAVGHSPISIVAGGLLLLGGTAVVARRRRASKSGCAAGCIPRTTARRSSRSSEMDGRG